MTPVTHPGLAKNCVGQYHIAFHGIDTVQCMIAKSVVTNNRMDSDDYKLGRACGVFLQGFDVNLAREEHNWVMVEFWSRNLDAINSFVDHLVQQMNNSNRYKNTEEFMLFK